MHRGSSRSNRFLNIWPTLYYNIKTKCNYRQYLHNQIFSSPPFSHFRANTATSSHQSIGFYWYVQTAYIEIFSAFINAFLTDCESRTHWSSSSYAKLSFVAHFSLYTKKQLLREIKLQTKSSEHVNNVQYWRSCVYGSQSSYTWDCRDCDKFSSQHTFPKIKV